MIGFGKFFNRAKDPDGPSGAAVEIERRVARHNAWREQYNPLRSLSMVQAVTWLEQAQRGEFADIQWAYSFIERRDADLLAIVERRLGAVLQMDWDIKTVESIARKRGLTFDSKLASEQQAALRAAYDRFSNLYAAIEHLCMATFRGYAHVQYLADGQILRDLNCLDQWNISRDGLGGEWYWNPDSRSVIARNLPADQRLNPAAYLVRVNARPVNEIALIKFLRQNLSAKDWDGFLEIYGIPGWIVFMPSNVPTDKVAEYSDAAENVAKGGSGALPNGSDAKCADQPRGTIPFEPHLRYWTEKLVLAGTGGLLTMLSQPTGIGQGATGAHSDAFDTLARAEARRISELFQRTVDRFILAQSFPNKPALAYFSMAANEEIDIGAILQHAALITQAGGQVDWTQISEKTGYRIVPQPPTVVSPISASNAPLRNRASGATETTPTDPAESARTEIVSEAIDQTIAAQTDLLAPWLARFDALAADPELSEPEFLDAFEAIIRDMPAALLTRDNVARLASIREGALGAAVVNALSEAVETTPQVA